MLIGKDASTSNWMASVGTANKLLREIAKISAHLPEDPFTARKALSAIAEKLKALGLQALSPPTELTHQLESECIRLKAEFWDQFGHVCRAHDWEIQGTTSRRLLKRGLFIEANDEGVNVENLPPLTFHVPSLVKAIEPAVDALVPSGHDPRHFLDLIARAYDALGGEGEQSVEEIYKRVLWNVQKATFWKSLNTSQFVSITRSQFRARLTQMIEIAQKTSDGRELRFGTTVQPREAWELYSPGEGRVVQIGRVMFL